MFELVLKGSSVTGLGPCLPDTDQLDYDPYGRCGVLSQSNQTLHECPGLVVRRGWGSSDGPKSVQLSQRQVMHAEAEDPELVALVIARGCGI